MSSRRRRKTTFVDGEGKEHEIDALTIDLRKGSLEDLLEDALSADEDDSIIRKKSDEIKNFIRRTSGEKNTLRRRYELGKILQFVDNLNLKDEGSKREAFLRLFKDLKVDAERNPSIGNLIKYPIHMYNLSKLPKGLVFYKGMTWSRWFDILEYRLICNDVKLLSEIVKKCCDNNWDAKRLRKEVQSINRKLKSR